jgi:hypothetical protein
MRYVVIGYVLTYGTLLCYTLWLGRRLRVARKRLGDRT